MLDNPIRPEATQPAPQTQRDYITRADVVRFIRRNFLIVMACFAVGILSALAYVKTATPTYTARAQLLIDPKLSMVVADGANAGNQYLDAAQIESQIAVMRSKELAIAVIDAERLLEDPEFQPRPPTGLTAIINKLLGRGPAPLSELSKEERYLAALGPFEGGLAIHRNGISYAIDIYFTSFSPEKAARLANATANAYLQSLLDVRVSASKLGREWLQDRIKELRGEMNNAARKLQEYKARQDYRIRRQNVPETKSSTNTGEKKKEREPETLVELEATAEIQRKLYESFFQAFAETVHRESYPVSNARLISKANTPSSKSHPKTRLVLALGALMGLFAGLGIALLRHGLDRSVNSAEQLREEVGIDCLGEVPRFAKTPPERLRNRIKRRVLELFGKRTAPEELGITLHNPYSSFSDGIKYLKVALGLASKTQRLRTIAITSASPGEGKTTIATNLASQLASPESPTLLIDADIRNPSLSRVLAPNAETGLIEALDDPTQVENTIMRLENFGVDLLPVHEFAYHAGIEDLLASERMENLLAQLSQSYETIIVDLPPLRIGAEAVILGTYVDGVIIVTEWEMTPLHMIADVYNSLRKAKANVIGTVINKVNPRYSIRHAETSRSYRYKMN